MNIIFLGAPGAGKGTIASMIAKRQNFTHICPGNLFREEAKKETKLGKEIKKLIESGTLVSDDITNELIKSTVKENNIFDGYPRTINQAEALDSHTKIDLVVLFDMSEEQIVKRLSGRRTCPNCQAIYHTKNIPPKKEGVCDKCGHDLIQRKDDQPGIVKNRFLVYHKQTAPLIEMYEARGVLKKVDAFGTPEVVCLRVQELINSA